MKHIEFKGKYAEKILKGEKTATIRKRVYVKPNDVVFVHSGGKIIGKARIKEVRQIDIQDLDHELARKEGFDNIEELMDEIREYYGEGKDLYLIEFDFEPFDEPLDPEKMYYDGSSLSEIARKALKLDSFSEDEKRILELFLKTGSIRKTAFRLGGLSKRGIVRKTIRKAFKAVREKES